MSQPAQAEKIQTIAELKFPELKMERLAGYDIPDNIWSAQIESDQFALNELKELMKNAREDSDSYFKAIAAMLQLEEVANSEGLRSFNFMANTDNIKIVSEKAAKIKISVNVR